MPAAATQVRSRLDRVAQGPRCSTGWKWRRAPCPLGSTPHLDLGSGAERKSTPCSANPSGRHSDTTPAMPATIQSCRSPSPSCRCCRPCLRQVLGWIFRAEPCRPRKFLVSNSSHCTSSMPHNSCNIFGSRWTAWRVSCCTRPYTPSPLPTSTFFPWQRQRGRVPSGPELLSPTRQPFERTSASRLCEGSNSGRTSIPLLFDRHVAGRCRRHATLPYFFPRPMTPGRRARPVGSCGAVPHNIAHPPPVAGRPAGRVLFDPQSGGNAVRRTTLALSMLAGFAALAGPAIASSYCDGYRDGYKSAFCAGRPVCFDGTPRGCPGDPYAPNTYQAGYNRGYSDGAAAARRSR